MRIKLFTRHEYFAEHLKGHVLVEDAGQADLIISYDWPKIIRLNGVPGINMHIAYLPFNRGADPNLWSWLEGTPKGVTIHWMDHQIDTGNILVQKCFPDSELQHMTLKESYDFLHVQIEKLFDEHFPKLLSYEPIAQQNEKSTSHRSSELTDLKKWLAEREYRVLPAEMIQEWKKYEPRSI